MAVLFFDLDGTLINEAKAAPRSALEAIAQAKRNGHLLFLNTGRPYCNIDRVARTLGLDGYICGVGTTVVYHDEILYALRQKPEDCRALAQQLAACGLFPIYEAHEAIYFDLQYAPPQQIRDMRDWVAGSGAPLRDLREPDFHFDKFSVHHRGGCDWERARGIITEAGFTILDISAQTMELMPAGVTKATGMARLLERLGMEEAETFAFGDSTNDLAMLEAAKHPVAMGNCNLALRPLVEYVTTDVDDDGIRNALLHYGLI